MLWKTASRRGYFWSYFIIYCLEELETLDFRPFKVSFCKQQRLVVSLTGTVASHIVPEASKGTSNQDGHLTSHRPLTYLILPILSNPIHIRIGVWWKGLYVRRFKQSPLRLYGKIPWSHYFYGCCSVFIRGLALKGGKRASLIDRQVDQTFTRGLVIHYSLKESIVIKGLSYARDNRVIVSESSHCRYCLLPRCRLILSSGCTSSEGFCCSQTKKVRELGSIRRKAVWLIPAVRKDSARRGGLLVRKDQSACINCEPVVG